MWIAGNVITCGFKRILLLFRYFSWFTLFAFLWVKCRNFYISTLAAAIYSFIIYKSSSDSQNTHLEIHINKCKYLAQNIILKPCISWVSHGSISCKCNFRKVFVWISRISSKLGKCVSAMLSQIVPQTSEVSNLYCESLFGDYRNVCNWEIAESFFQTF